MRKFYPNINILLRKFSKCSPDVKCTLFKSFCSSMYGSTMWYNCTVTAMRRLRIAYNNSLRRLFGIPKHNSPSGVFVQLNILNHLVNCSEVISTVLRTDFNVQII